MTASHNMYGSTAWGYKRTGGRASWKAATSPATPHPRAFWVCPQTHAKHIANRACALVPHIRLRRQPTHSQILSAHRSPTRVLKPLGRLRYSRLEVSQSGPVGGGWEITCAGAGKNKPCWGPHPWNSVKCPCLAPFAPKCPIVPRRPRTQGRAQRTQKPSYPHMPHGPSKGCTSDRCARKLNHDT